MPQQLTWAKTFPNAARRLSERERDVLDQGVPSIRNSMGISITSGDTDAMNELFQAQSIWSGANVTPEAAAKITAVYACTRLIAGAIASLPLGVYEAADPVRNALTTHPLRKLLNERPTPRYSAAAFWEFIAASVLLRGDGFAYLKRNGNGSIVEIVPVPSQFVVIQRIDEGSGAAKISYYVYYVTDGKDYFALHQDDMLHFQNFGSNALGSALNLRSMSVVRAAAQSMGIALAAEEYSGRFFNSGATPKFVLATEKKLTDEAVKTLREAWERRYSGPSNSFKPLILTEGLTATALSITAADAQLLESRKFQIIDIARAFGVPPHMIGDVERTSSFGTGVAEQGIIFLMYTLQPHLTRFEQEVNAKCFSSRAPIPQFAEFNVKGLMRGDPKSQNEAYRQAIGGSNGPGWMGINEVRRLENLPPHPDGDGLYIPKNAPATQTPANNAMEGTQNATA